MAEGCAPEKGQPRASARPPLLGDGPPAAGGVSARGSPVSAAPLVLMPEKNLVSYELHPPWPYVTHSTQFLSELPSQRVFFFKKE